MKKLLLAIALLLGSSGVTSAAPMHTDFATIRKDATSVVLGTVNISATGDITIDVDKVLRGPTVSGTIKVKPSPDGHIDVTGERVVAFLNASNELRWIGRKSAGATIETGVIQMKGFFDFNAHLVSPGMMTLKQLDALLSSGTLSQAIGITLAFPDGHGGHKASSKKFTLVWDAIARKGSVPGFSGACLDLGSVYGFEWGSVELSFNDTCTRKAGSRSLRLEGKPTGVDAAGNITAELEPAGPILTEPEYDTFIADGSVLDVIRLVRITIVADGSTWAWHIDKRIEDPSGKMRPAGGWGSSYEDKGGKSVETQTFEFGDVKVALSTSSHIGGNNLSLVSAIDAGVFTSCTLLRKGLAPAACTAKQGAPVWVK
jgi:hypothetical protein